MALVCAFPSGARAESTEDPAAVVQSVRDALANVDDGAVRAMVTHDVELHDLSEDGEQVPARGPAGVARRLLEDTGGETGPGPALQPREAFVFGHNLLAVERLPRVVGMPERISVYETYQGRVLRIWRWPVVPRGTPSDLDAVRAYVAAWSSGHWPAVAARHAPDMTFQSIFTGTLRTQGTGPQRRACYDSTFRRWRTRHGDPSLDYHPYYNGCRELPREIVEAVSTGPYVATLEKRYLVTWPDRAELALYLYVTDPSGLRRVIEGPWLRRNDVW
jgi:hypothetical protein